MLPLLVCFRIPPDEKRKLRTINCKLKVRVKPQVYTISFHNLVISFGKVRVLREHKELLKVFMVPPIELTR